MKFIKGNCLVAQSGGPTSVINSSAYGVISTFLSYNTDNKVYLGIYGVKGILEKKLIDVNTIDKKSLEGFRFMPSSGLGSCRYKLKPYEESEEEYKKIFDVFKEYNIKYFFYIGGNDSMDAASKLSAYAEKIGYDIHIMGIPKTIDNDLILTDHCPGFGSSAKYIAATCSEVWCDINTYNYGSIVVVEAMGRDAGWLTASSGVIKKNIKDINQLIYIPEIAFDENEFLKDVRNAFAGDRKLLIVTSEGLKDSKGEYVQVGNNSYDKDEFGHKQLGGIGRYLHFLLKKEVTPKVKFLELNITQRAAMHCVSKTDLDEAAFAGAEGVKYAIEGKTGYMVAFSRKNTNSYEIETKLVPLCDVCNKVKVVPVDYMDVENRNINDKMMDYVLPLIKGEENTFDENGLMKYNEIKKF